jgi:hypothetical protein
MIMKSNIHQHNRRTGRIFGSFALFILILSLLSAVAGARPLRWVAPPSQKIVFTFTLPAAAKTSAGVFASDSTLVKTLWSNVQYAAGTFTAIWDGTTDDGQLAANGSYQVRVLSHNVTYTWEGVIGNTSTAFSGSTVHKGYDRVSGMAFAGSAGYLAKGYSEGSPAQAKILTSTPQSKITLFPVDGTGVNGSYVVTDGINVYWAGVDPFNAKVSFVFGTKVSNDTETTFSSGIPVKAKYGRTYPSTIDTLNNVNAEITGLAVQKSGIYLLVAHKSLNQLHVLNKTTGARVQTLTYSGARALAIDTAGNLWMCYTSGGSPRIEKFQVNPDGTLTSLSLLPTGLIDPLAMGVSPDNATLVIADGGSSQQLKAYSNSTAASSWTYGQLGGYANGASVSNDKFYFSDTRSTIGTFVSFQPDGTFWVSDAGNYRAQHYAADRTFIDRIMYFGRFYSCFVDKNNPTRVFGDYLEFSIDYSKPVAPNNGSWTLVNNWGYSIPLAYDSEFNRMRSVTTLNNGKTYAMFANATTSKWQVTELTSTGTLRFTGILVPIDNSQLYPDGSLRKLSVITLGQPSVYRKKLLTGFDGSANPLWGTEVITASTPTATGKDPGYWGSGINLKAGETTTSGVMVAFDAGGAHTGYDNYHLGGILPGKTKWLWRTAMSTTIDYTGDFPPNGNYDIGNTVNYSGSSAMALDKSIYWAYHGENWKAGQTNKWNQVYEDGLFIGQFGVTGADVLNLDAPAMMAGNCFSVNVLKGPDSATYIYHNDESFHSGIHRWKVNGLSTISEQQVPVTLAMTNHGLLGRYFDGSDLNNLNPKTSRIDSMVHFDYTQTNLSDPQNFTVVWTGYVSPLYSQNYTFFTRTDEGVRLWIDGKLVIDQRNATTAAEYSTAVIALTAGTKYPVRMEFYQHSGTSSAALLYSSTSQAKIEIPTAQLSPAEMPDAAAGVDLMKDLPYHQTVENNAYGWTRSPTVDDLTSTQTKYWTASTNLRSPDRSAPDLLAKYRVTAAPTVATINRDLGTVGNYITAWKLSGTISYSGTYPNYDSSNLGPDGLGGSFIEVLDDQNKVIARVFWNGIQTTKIIRLFANTQMVTSGYIDTMRLVYNASQPLEISALAGMITVKYGKYTAVTTTVMDSTSNWKSPKTMRLYFWTKTASPLSNLDRVIDIEKMRFSTTTAPPVGSVCWPPE